MTRLDDGIALFNAGRYAEALAVFRREARAESAGPASLFIAHCLRALGRDGQKPPRPANETAELVAARRRRLEARARDRRKAEERLARFARTQRALEAKRRASAARASREREQSAALVRQAVEADRFRKLVGAGRYGAAFALGARLAGRAPAQSTVSAFWYPWDPAKFTATRAWHARRLAAGRYTGEAAAWARLYGAVLAVDADPCDGVRWPHAWMDGKVGQLLLLHGRIEASCAWLERGVEDPSLGFLSAGFLAEAYSLLGRDAEARALFAGAKRRFGAESWPTLQAWRGAISLWSGRYPAAIEDLRDAAAGGAFWAHGWLGAAQIASGKLEDGRRSLELALEKYPRDYEARIWRGEALRRSGRHREALRALAGIDGPWAAVNRLLAHAALGEGERARREWSGLKPDFAAWLAGGRPAAGDLAAPQALAEAGLRRARGWRRDSHYGLHAWEPLRSRRAAQRAARTGRNPT